MRRPSSRPLLAVLAAAIVLVGLAAPFSPVERTRAAVSGPKVVIVVGPVEGTTPTYRSYGDQAAAEALKYTSNVVKIYSPNATWSAVKSALQGANVVVYLGHGNGFPSPYRSTAWPYSQNGFGLNAAAGKGDSNVQYWGEYYVGNEVRFAPNAVVILSHLCYAAGNSEPGNPEPTVSVAHQRIDNYGAGFLKAGARAVIAETHGTPATWITKLFTTRQTIERAWRTYPYANGNVVSWASTRSSGYTSFSDPDKPTSGFYRALVGAPTLQTGDVVGNTDTGADPTDFIVPGAASVDAGGAGLYSSASLGWKAAPSPSPTPTPATDPSASPTPVPSPTATPAPIQDPPSATLPEGTKLRLLAQAPNLWDGSRVFQVTTLDGSKTGYLDEDQIIPRDSFGPWLRTWSASDWFSPNGDGVDDVFKWSGTISETIAWSVRIKDASGKTVAQGTGTSAAPFLTWDGADGGGAHVPDGTYTWQVTGADAWGNPPLDASGTFTVDSHLVTSPVVTFVPLGPVRLLDTRVGTGLSGAFTNRVPRTVQIAGRGGVPANAIAVTLNVTVTAQTRAGYVAVTPSPTANPSTSTINFPVGDDRANGATVSLGTGGTLSATYVGSGSTQLIFDITGYYVQTGGKTFVPIDPVRLLDTRVGNGLSGAFTNRAPRTVQIAGRGGVPADAVAVTVNVTVTAQTKAGYVAVTPDPTADPSTSTINFPVGDDRANGATVSLGPGGTLSATYVGAGATQLIFDVTGYFVASGGRTYVPIDPIRVLDTRTAVGLSGAFTSKVPRTLQIAGRGGIPGDAKAVTVNVTVTAQTKAGYVSVTPGPTANPSTSTINFPLRDDRANGATVSLGAGGTLSAVYMGTGATQLIFDITGYYR